MQSQQVFRSVAAASRRTQFPPSAPHLPGPCPLTQVRPQSCPPRLVKLDHYTPSHALPSVKGSSRQKLDQRTFTEQIHEGKDNGYLFPKVYLADATHKCMHHNPKLSSDLQGKRYTMGWSPTPSWNLDLLPLTVPAHPWPCLRVMAGVWAAGAAV